MKHRAVAAIAALCVQTLAFGQEWLFYGGDASQLGKQAIAAFSVMGYSFVLTLIIALVLKYTMGLRVTEEEEITGIDQTVHAESAYEFAGLGSAGSGSLAGGSATPTAPAQMKVHS